MPLRSGGSYNSVDDILTPADADMIDDIGEELDDDPEMQHTYPRSFLTTKQDSKYLTASSN